MVLASSPVAETDQKMLDSEGYQMIADELAERLTEICGFGITPLVRIAREDQQDRRYRIVFLAQPSGINDSFRVLEIEQLEQGEASYKVDMYEHFTGNYYVLTTLKALEIQDAVEAVFKEAFDNDVEFTFSVLNVGNYGLAQGEREGAAAVLTWRRHE